MTIEKVLIIGSGPAGLTAAIYASRAGLEPLIIEGKKPGGQLMSTTYVENWPATKRILGPELMMNMRAHAESLGTRFASGEVSRVDFSSQPFRLWTTLDREFHAQSIIVATGSTPKRLGCPGEDTYWGRGVTTCAVCDGAFFKDKKVIIVGGGDTAMEDALFMSNFTKDITIVHILDSFTASQAMQKRVLKNPSIKVLYNSTLTSIDGDGVHVKQATIVNQKTGESSILPVDGIFVAIGLKPNSDAFKGHLELHPAGYILINKHGNMGTSVPGIFAAGDIVDLHYRQAITSAAMGCMATLEVERYLCEQS